MFTAPHQFRQGGVSFQVYVFVLDAAPDPFHEDVVQCFPAPVETVSKNSPAEEVALLRRWHISPIPIIYMTNNLLWPASHLQERSLDTILWYLLFYN